MIVVELLLAVGELPPVIASGLLFIARPEKWHVFLDFFESAF
jgi:hypothetical protein